MKIIFLGTNGWYSTKTGNTVSVLVQTPSRYIVFDAGDGIHRLNNYVKDEKPIDIFLSHFHLDHTIGLHIQPKFMLMKNKFRIFGQPGTTKILNTLVNRPFTAPYSLLKKQGFELSIHELHEGENKIDEYKIIAGPLVHADPCWGYRLEINEGEKTKIISYCTDTGPCENLVNLSKGADVLITECSMLPGEAVPADWPHLNPHEAAKAAKKAGCKRLILSHFAAQKYTSMELRRKAEKNAKEIFENSGAAEDEMAIEI
ncbi:MAG: ribonuclease Z [Candidatus Micrarchaeota archaeon]